jgi:hypothetical protein
LCLPLRHYLTRIVNQAGITGKPPHYQAVVHQLQPMHGVVRKDDAAISGTVENAGVEKRLNIPMHRLDVTADAPGRLPDRHGALTGHRLEQLPTLPGQSLPEEFD